MYIIIASRYGDLPVVFFCDTLNDAIAFVRAHATKSNEITTYKVNNGTVEILDGVDLRKP